MSQVIDFYFDFSSAYTYVGLGRIEQIARNAGRGLNRLPVALGAIFKDRQHSPPAADSAKGRYLALDLARCAAEQGMPFRWPRPFPYNSIPAARGYLWLAARDPDRAADYTRQVFHAAFGEGRDMSSIADLQSLAAGLGFDLEAFAAGLHSPEVKAQLVAQTQAAAGRGVFGAPTLFAGGEMFWGADRLYQLENHLVGAGR